MKTKRWTPAVALSSLLLAGCAGTGEDLCTSAVLHLEACTGATLEQLPDTCDPEKARRVLDASCSELAEAGVRGTASFWDWFGSWFGDGAEEPLGEKPHEGCYRHATCPYPDHDFWGDSSCREEWVCPGAPWG